MTSMRYSLLLVLMKGLLATKMQRYFKEHLQTEFSMLNIIVTLSSDRACQTIESEVLSVSCMCTYVAELKAIKHNR